MGFRRAFTDRLTVMRLRERDTYLVNFSLNNQPPTASRYELFENLFEVLGDLFECSFDCFVLALVQNFDKFLD